MHPPRRGALRDTQRNLAPPAEGLSEIHKEIWDLFFPKRLTSRGFRNQKEGGAGFWPISPGSVSEGSVAVVIPIDLTPIQSSTSVIQSSTSVHFGVHPPPRGSRRYTKKSGTPRGGALGDTQRNLGPFFLGLTTLLVFFF